jgi:hypothetical protein
MGKHGLACDNLLSVELVTAEGKPITANAEQNSDLFWGIRGGGGNFGIVTWFEYRLHPVGEVLAGMVMWPLAKGKEVLSFYRYFAKEAPNKLNTLVTLLTDPQGGLWLRSASATPGLSPKEKRWWGRSEHLIRPSQTSSAPWPIARSNV